MPYDINVFLEKKIKEINYSIDFKNTDMYDIIGSVRDIFSSAYAKNSICELYIFNELWNTLCKVFLNNNLYSNQFESIFTMSYLCVYAQNNSININIDNLKKWREVHDKNNSTEEILECIDDIISDYSAACVPGKLA